MAQLLACQVQLAEHRQHWNRNVGLTVAGCRSTLFTEVASTSGASNPNGSRIWCTPFRPTVPSRYGLRWDAMHRKTTLPLPLRQELRP